jgi:hypothetical protein
MRPARQFFQRAAAVFDGGADDAGGEKESLPRVVMIRRQNPERVEAQVFMKEIQPLQGCYFCCFLPKVARAPAFATLRRGPSQPWADGFNPVGIGKTK